MAIIPFHIVDAFADRPFTGNPAAIIPNAASLTETEMLQITDELSMEAGFVLPPEVSGADVRLRFSLPPGSYATVLIETLFGSSDEAGGATAGTARDAAPARAFE